MSHDLTGRWDGIYNYPRTRPPTGYVALLGDRDGALTGEIEEVSEAGEPLAAVLDGERVGSQVRFTKRYDDVERAYYAVDYEGGLSAEGDEITGEWTIPGVWSGTFIMVRATRSGEQVVRVAEQEVR